MAFPFKFFSWKKTIPPIKETTTELRRTIDTMEIMASGSVNA